MPISNGMPVHGEACFVVLPDCEAASTVYGAIKSADTARDLRTVFHPSGRPWLIGRWSDAEITVAAAGERRVAVIGCCPIGAAGLALEAERMDHIADVDRLARSLAGSFHLVAHVGGRIRAQGTASGVRLLFHARINGVTVAADRADVLAALLGAGLNEEQVAARLLWPVPHPLLDGPLWRGVEPVPPGRYLLVERGGERSSVATWWTPPPPTRSLAEAAPTVREALTAAVEARTRAGGVVSTDLSGGLDSTSVTFLAASGNATVLAGTWPGIDPNDDDLEWALRAASHLPDVEHLVWSTDEYPLVYERLLEIDDPLDEPTIGMVDRARAMAHLPWLAARGSRVHLTGLGGDHLAWCSEAYYHGLLRRRPMFALRQLRGFRALFHWRTGPMVRALIDRRSYGRWLRGCIDELRAPEAAEALDALGWGVPPRLQPWATDTALEAARRVILQAADTAEPLAPDRGQHQDIHQIRDSARILRQWEQMSSRVGLPMSSPFFDDRVIEACISVRPEERVTPWQYKPLLTAAMRDVVPAECLARTTKAEASLDSARGLQEHRGDLYRLWEESRLADLGLVDRTHLMALAQRPSTPGLERSTLYSTIGCEIWLRTLDAVPAGPLAAG